MEPTVIPLIDPALWDEAQWRGVTFSYQENRPPFLALAFDNGAAGRRLVEQLREVTGPVDTFELIRIAFVEGTIPGESAGYTVHIAPNQTGFIAKAKSEGAELPTEIIGVSKYLRTSTSGALANLAKFKTAFGAHHRYLLGYATIGDHQIHFDLTIEKTLAIFKDVSQIGKDDIDQVIFVNEHHGPRH